MTCEICGSDQVEDLRNGDDDAPAFCCCHDCGSHYYRGQWWARSEWDGWTHNKD